MCCIVLTSILFPLFIIVSESSNIIYSISIYSCYKTAITDMLELTPFILFPGFLPFVNASLSSTSKSKRILDMMLVKVNTSSLKRFKKL